MCPTPSRGEFKLNKLVEDGGMLLAIDKVNKIKWIGMSESIWLHLNSTAIDLEDEKSYIKFDAPLTHRLKWAQVILPRSQK